MRAIDYFDRGHDRDPSRLAIIDTEERPEADFRRDQGAVRTHRCGAAEARVREPGPAGLYGPNDGMLLVVVLAMRRANGKWIPVNTRNAIEANAAYINYVRLKWMVYHSSKADEVQRAQGSLPHAPALRVPRQADGQ
jgi:ABC-type sugar transport system substrate-binding protein